MVAILVLLARLILPLTILRWPLGGVLLSLAADTMDIVFLNYFGWGPMKYENYQQADKILDIYYFAFAVFVSLRWQDILARKVSVILFFWRFLGVLIFEITQIRKVLFFTPNIFEPFYLIVSILRKRSSAFRFSGFKKLGLLLVIIGIPKFIHEYILHFVGYPLGVANSLKFLKELLSNMLG